MGTLSVEELLRLPPTIYGKIRWKNSIGRPIGDPCSGFDILVEEHTTTEFVDVGGGQNEPTSGTGLDKIVTDALTCRGAPDEGDYHVVRFKITGLHYNTFPDGGYRVTPRLAGTWGSPSFFGFFSGFRLIEPLSDGAVLTANAPIKMMEFEVFRRSWFSGRRLP